MSKTVSHTKETITQCRQLLPPKNATAYAIDRQEPWERTAQDAGDDGATESYDEVVRFIEACIPATRDNRIAD